MKKHIYVIITIAVLVLGIVIFFYIKGKKQDQEIQLNPGNVPTGLPEGSFPLKYGNKNQLVAAMQGFLNRSFGEKLATDGAWGPNTDAAVKRAMVKLKRAEDGIVDADDFGAIRDYQANNADPSVQTWRNNTWISGNILDAYNLFYYGKQEFRTFINNAARFTDAQLRLIAKNYNDYYFRSFGDDVRSYANRMKHAAYSHNDVRDAYATLVSRVNALKL